MASPGRVFNFGNSMAKHPDNDPFLLAFFGAGNDISWADVCSHPGWQQAMTPWVRRYEREQPFLLPRRVGGDLSWYAFAFSPRQMRSLREDLAAFIDKTYSDFDGAPYACDCADAVDNAMFQRFGGNAYRMKVREAERALFRERIDLMRSIWDAQPGRQKAARVPVGRLLRDFAMAVRSGDGLQAGALIDAIRRTGHLSPENLVFLQIELLGGLGHWAEIRGHTSFEDLLAAPAPARIVDHLAAAVYHAEFEHFEAAGDWRGAMESMREHLPLYGRLIRRLAVSASPSSLKTLLLALACDPQAPSAQKAETLVWFQAHEASTFLQPVVELLSQAEPKAAPLTALKAYEAYDFPLCLELLAARALSVPEARMLVHAAAEVRTVDACRIACARIGRLDPAIKAEVLENPFIRAKWDAISKFVEGLCPAAELPRSWVDWASALSESDAFCRRAHTVAREAVAEWDYGAYLSKPEMIDDFVSALGLASSPQAISALKLSLPYLLEFFLPDPSSPAPQFKEVYGHLLMILAVDDEIGAHDLEASLDLCNSMLGLGSVGAVLDAVEALFDRCASAQHIAWMLDVVDLLILHGKGGEVIGNGLFTRCIQVLAAHGHRIRPEQWMLAEVLAGELGPHFIIPERKCAAPDRVELVTPLAGAFIGIYSLTEKAAERAGRMVERVFQARRVETNSDKVATDRLRSLAGKADILVVATGSAKHAATDAIQAVRGNSRPTLYPSGRGCSSIVRALLEYEP
jgi:hypothetical protein